MAILYIKKYKHKMVSKLQVTEEGVNLMKLLVWHYCTFKYSNSVTLLHLGHLGNWIQILRLSDQ